MGWDRINPVYKSMEVCTMLFHGHSAYRRWFLHRIYSIPTHD